MKKVAVMVLVLFLLAALVVGGLGIRRLQRWFDPTPFINPRSLPGIAWIGASQGEREFPLRFDLRRFDGFPAAVDFPVFSAATGWSDREQEGTWAIGHRADFVFSLDSIRPRTLVLDMNRVEDLFEQKRSISVSLNDHHVGRLWISDSNPLSTLHLPIDSQMEGSNRLVFEFDSVVRPRDRIGGDDTRPLAAWFRNITIMDGRVGQIGAWSRTVKTFWHVPKNETDFSVLFAEEQRLVVKGSGTIVSAIYPDNRREMDLEVDPAVAVDAITVTAHDLTGHSQRTTLTTESEDGMARATIQLPGQFTTAFLEIGIGAHVGRELHLGSPWLTTLGVPPVSESKPIEAGRNQQVNLVVIILDAARPDHFGCYGSVRPATPSIDRLARESVVFENVVALAPYTLCSVPTMTTGLSFLDHGIVQHHQRLSGASTTLAEVLSEAGYQTAGFSATPNNSRDLGVAQGFEVFKEAWRGVDSVVALNPLRLVQMAERWLDGCPQERPFFLLVHMVPPHEPYRPGPVFDQFSDPNYEGPADGSQSFMARFNTDPRGLVSRDLDHTTALYDGNLLKADAAVGHLLDSLRNRKDWGRTVVLVTADHGEALGEHALIGHNKQVYEEMIRVPFILKLPGSLGSQARGMAGRQASLADLAPTLAALAGRKFPGPIAGRNLLSEEPVEPRAMVIRSDHKNPVYGLRTPRWKLVVRNHVELELFDLWSDPGERNNLAGSRLKVAAGLRQVLLTRLAVEPLFVAEEKAELDRQDEAMLRTLGYLR